MSASPDPADAVRMDALFARRDDAGLSPAEDAELERLANAWQHAVYLDSLDLAPPDWAPPALTEDTVRRALADAGHPADEGQVAMVMRAIRRGDGA